MRALRLLLLAGVLLGALSAAAPRRLKQAQATGLTPCIGAAFPLALPNATASGAAFVRSAAAAAPDEGEGEAEGEADAPDIADVQTFATWSPQGELRRCTDTATTSSPAQQPAGGAARRPRP